MKKNVQTFGKESYPPEMRRQLWALCCGASIISGFKAVNSMSEEDIVKSIEDTINNEVPDMQVFGGETICPKLTFLTLNESQIQIKPLMAALDRTGFVKFGEGRPRGSLQSFYYRDESKTFKVA